MSKRKAKPKASVHLASAETAENGALCAPCAASDAREARIGSRPGQAVYNGLFDDKLEAEILGHIANGCNHSDAARLCGISRESSINWRTRGAAYLKNPEEHPQDARYGLFVQRIEEAVLRCKAVVIGKLLRSDDWRAWRFWLINNSEYKSEHVRSEVSGVDGQPVELKNMFQVNVSMPNLGDIKWSVIDHSSGHRESQQVPDPFLEQAPRTEEPAADARLNEPEAPAPQPLSPYDPMSGRGRSGDVGPRKARDLRMRNR